MRTNLILYREDNLILLENNKYLSSAKGRKFLLKLHQKIKEHVLNTNFSIDNIAHSLCMSRSTFYRRIKKITGMAPHQYLKIIRLNIAANLLCEEDMSLNEICEKLAFSSSSYFAKCFKSQFGVLPKDFRIKQECKSHHY